MTNRLRPLSAAQAANCENAREPVCRCRCGGAGHGAKRAPVGREDDRTFYEQLSDTDPHHLPSDDERRELRRLRKQIEQLTRYAGAWNDGHPEQVRTHQAIREARRTLARVECIVLGARAPIPALGHSTEYDVWWCPTHGEWTVASRPHSPKCPTCGEGGWWRRFTTGVPYLMPEPAPGIQIVEPLSSAVPTST